MSASTVKKEEKSVGVNPFPGETLDCDGHAYIPPDVLKEILPELCFGDCYEFLSGYMAHPEYAERRVKRRDELWQTKGIGAMGAFDPEERIEALDVMGIKSQLLFANHNLHDLRAITSVARDASIRYNDYALDFTQRTGGRCRAVCHLNMSDVDFALTEVRRVIKNGARGVVLPHAVPPAGVSPSHEKWDPLWALLAEADVPAFLHLGGQGTLGDCNDTPHDPMLPDPRWRESSTLRVKPAFRNGGEEAVSPYFMLVLHMAPELYLQTMIMGKVFERHPKLRFGIIECGASWVGPCVERMDQWSDFMAKLGVKYEMKPSEFMRQNVRVTPFWHEDLAKMIDRYGLKEVYVFNSDYPHLEGSKDPFGKFEKHLAKLPDGYRREFYIENSKLLLPNA